MELLKDYNCTILYHPNKVNMVVNALNHKSIGSLDHIVEVKRPLIEKIHGLEANGAKIGDKGAWSTSSLFRDSINIDRLD